MPARTLTDKEIQAFGPGLHTVGFADTLGLKLQVKQKPNGDLWRGWIFQYRWTDPVSGEKTRPQLGLGGYQKVSLKKARELAREARGYLTEKPRRNPRDVWKHAAQDAVAVPTFGEAAKDYLSAILNDFRNEKHKAQWRSSLTTYCSPIWMHRVNSIDTEAVLQVLKPIWNEKRETAKRVRGRMERVLDAARVKGWRSGENPARWKGNLSALLPNQAKPHQHFAAMPIDDVPGFMAKLEQNGSISALALQFLILTAARSGEARGARWSEIDLNQAVWTIPVERLKSSRRPHVVPLSARCMEILQAMAEIRRGDFVFSNTGRAEISESALRKLMRDTLKVKGATMHGFRSTFRDWAGDRTSFPRETAELCLAHKFGNEVERAYRRSDDLNRRRELMNAWERFCTGKSDKTVVKLHG